MFAEWLFEPQCPACAAPSRSLCAACAPSLVELGPACPRCAAPSEAGDALCRRCVRAPLPLVAISAAWQFGGALATAIRRLKFTAATHIARDLAPLWAPLVAAAATATPNALIVPVPLHWRRRLRRGFDHGWLLAHHACAAAGLAPPLPALRRIRHAPAQSTLPAAARRANLAGAFVARDPVALAGRAVVLLDDVATTGATLAAAARAAHRAGAARVTAVVLARATSARG